MLSNHLILCRPLFLSPSILPSIRVFSSELVLCIRWPKNWSLFFNSEYWSLSNSPFNEYSGLISFKIDWIDLLAVQRTLKSLLQHHNSKASILWCSAYIMVQLSHLQVVTGKTTPLTVQTFVSKVMSLLFINNMLARSVTVFLPRSKPLLISWLQSTSRVILELKKTQFVTASTLPPSMYHEAMRPDTMILVFWMLSFKPAFSLSSFTFIKRLFSYCSLTTLKSAIICISEVTDISPSNPDSSLAFHMMYLSV